MSRSITITIGHAKIRLDDKGVCRWPGCGERIVHAARSDIWLHVGFVKGERTYADYKHRAQG